MDEKKPKLSGGGPYRRKPIYDGLRAAQMAIERATGKSIAEIARTFEVSVGQVHKALTAAQEAGFVEHFRHLGYDRLMTKAYAVYEAHLDMGDLDAARDIAFGLNVLRKESREGKLKEKAVTTLEEYRAQKNAAQPEDFTRDNPKEEVH